MQGRNPKIGWFLSILENMFSRKLSSPENSFFGKKKSNLIWIIQFCNFFQTKKVFFSAFQIHQWYKLSSKVFLTLTTSFLLYKNMRITCIWIKYNQFHFIFGIEFFNISTLFMVAQMLFISHDSFTRYTFFYRYKNRNLLNFGCLTYQSVLTI